MKWDPVLLACDGSFGAGEESGGTVRYLLEGAESFVDGSGVREGVEQVGLDDGDVCPLFQEIRVLAAYSFTEVQVGAWGEGVEFLSLAHIVLSRLR